MGGAFRAFRVYRDGDQIAGRLTTMQEGELTPGEVVIRTAFSSVNYKDALAATGKGRILRTFPLNAGIDVSGWVESSSDPRFRPGAEVLVTGFELGVARDGGYAERVRVPADWVVPLPVGLSLFNAMALGTAGFTVALCVKRLEETGQTPEIGPIAVTGATGGVGVIAIDVLSALGYSVTAITGKPSEAAFLRELGAREVLDRNALTLGTQPLEAAQWGGAIDNVGGEMLGWLTRTTRPWGNVVAVGLAGGSDLNTSVMPFILRGVGLLGVTSSGTPATWRAPLWQRLATDLHPRHLEHIITRVATLDELPEVFDAMLAGRARGRTVVRLC